MAASDPCAEVERLRELRLAIITGQSESQVRFGDEEVRFFKGDIAALEEEILRMERLCNPPANQRPLRYAKGLSFRRVCRF